MPQLSRDATSFLDLGTGNGHLLFDIREQSRFRGPMVGVDYSEESVRLANEMLCVKRRRSRRRKERSSSRGRKPVDAVAEKKADDEKNQRHREDLYAGIRFEKWDILSGDGMPASSSSSSSSSSSCLLDASDDVAGDDAFDVLLDKGTFDAISLDPALHNSSSTSSATRSSNSRDGETSSLGEMYVDRLTPLMKRDTGMLIVTSCNWTEKELCLWFARSGLLEPVAGIAYPTFTFAGKKGQTISSVVFRRRG